MEAMLDNVFTVTDKSTVQDVLEWMKKRDHHYFDHFVRASAGITLSLPGGKTKQAKAGDRIVWMEEQGRYDILFANPAERDPEQKKSTAGGDGSGGQVEPTAKEVNFSGMDCDIDLRIVAMANKGVKLSIIAAELGTTVDHVRNVLEGPKEGKGPIDVEQD